MHAHCPTQDWDWQAHRVIMMHRFVDQAVLVDGGEYEYTFLSLTGNDTKKLFSGDSKIFHVPGNGFGDAFKVFLNQLKEGDTGTIPPATTNYRGTKSLRGCCICMIK